MMSKYELELYEMCFYSLCDMCSYILSYREVSADELFVSIRNHQHTLRQMDETRTDNLTVIDEGNRTETDGMVTGDLTNDNCDTIVSVFRLSAATLNTFGCGDDDRSTARQ